MRHIVIGLRVLVLLALPLVVFIPFVRPGKYWAAAIHTTAEHLGLSIEAAALAVNFLFPIIAVGGIVLLFRMKV